MPIIIAAIAAIFVFCAVTIIMVILRRGELATSERVDKVVKATAKRESDSSDGSKFKAEKARPFKAGNKIATQLESAGILLKAEEFIIAWGAATVVPSGLLLLLGGSPITGFALAVGGAVIPPLLVSSARKRRLVLFEKQLNDALGVISNCLRAGFTFQQSIESISNEMAEPISKEFGKTLREIRLGVTFDDAMNNIVRRMQNEDLGMLISAVLIQRQVGGNLADIIDNISLTIRDRLKIKGEVKVMSASGRISGMVVGLLPVFITVILMTINPSYIMTFFTDPNHYGIYMLIVAGLMEITGFLIVQKIVDIKY